MTGLGWRLNAGGSITRQIRGIADDSDKGDGFLEFRSTHSFATLQSKWNALDGDYFFTLANGCYDSQPDEFYFSFGKYSGRFAFDWTGDLPVLSCNDDVKLISFTKAATGNQIIEWRMAAPDGYIYVFGAVERTTVINGNPSLASPCNAGFNTFNTSWHLTKIISPYNPAQYVEFIYNSYIMDNQWDGYEVVTYANPNGSNPPICFSTGIGYQPSITMTSSRTTIYGLQLSKIIAHPSNASLECSANTQRTDLQGTLNNNNSNFPLYALDAIVVKDGAAKLISTTRFSYVTYGRLMLTSIQQEGRNSEKPGTYEFTYSGGIPGIDSKSVDYWGFSNGAPNQTLVPAYKFVAYLQPSSPSVFTYNGADREPHPEYGVSGMLTKIKHPTGGITEFDYEANTYGSINLSDVSALGEYEQLGTMDGASVAAPAHTTTWYTDQKTITIDHEQVVEVMTNGTTWCVFAGAAYLPTATIKNADGTVIFEKRLGIHDGSNTPINQTSVQSIFLDPGTYTITANARYFPLGQPIGGDFMSIYVTYNKNGNLIREKTAGGVRIREIRERSHIGAPAKIRRYEYTMDDGVSSGVIYGVPIFKYDGTMVTDGSGDECKYFNLLGASQIITGATQSSHIGYRKVTEYFGEDGEDGKIATTYAFYADEINTMKPFGPPTSSSYKTGLPLEETIFKKGMTGFSMLRQTTTTYTFREYNINSMKVGYGDIAPPNPESSLPAAAAYGTYPFSARFAFWWFTLRYGHAQPATVIENYYENGGILTTSRTLTYDNNAQYLKKSSTTASNGDIEDVFLKYPKDYTTATSGDGMNNAVKELVARNIVGLPIETYENRNNATVSGNIVKYSLVNGQNPLPSEYLKLEPSQPITGFAASTFNSGTFSANSSYQSKIFYTRYNTNGQVSEQLKKNDYKTAYLRDVTGNYVIAQAVDAGYDDIAYTSFEPNAVANWTVTSAARISNDGVTGSACYNVGGGISRAGLSSSKIYIVSYWAKTGSNITVSGASAATQGPTFNGWTYFERKVTGVTAITIGGSGSIDELRFYPEGANMSSFTVDPLIGVTSECDVNNRITYYEYDGLNRLLLQRDQQKNIVKSFEYKYRQ